MDVKAVVAPLEEAVLAGDPATVAALLGRIDPAQRPALRSFVGTLARRIPAGPQPAAALALARVGVSAQPEQIATALADPAVEHLDPELVTALLADLDLDETAQVVQHLADAVVDCRDPRLVTIEAVCTSRRLPRPASPAYLRALATALAGADSRFGPDLTELLRQDSDLRELVFPMLSTVDVGRALGSGRWAEAIATVTAQGLIDRQRLLGLVLRSPELNAESDHILWFLDLHDHLAPTNPELEANADAYGHAFAVVGPDALPAMQRAMKQRDALDSVPVALFAALTSAVLARPERHAAQTQVRWARRYLHLQPTAADAICLALSTGLTHPLADVQQACLTEISRWVRADAIGNRTLDLIRDRALALNARAEAQLASPGSTPVAPRDLRHLANAAREYLFALDPFLGEVVLDGAAALAALDPAATRRALAEVRGQLDGLDEIITGDQGPVWLGERPVLALLGCLAFDEDHPIDDVVWAVPAGPPGALTMRCREVLDAIRAGHSRRLLALPTSATGAIDPEQLLVRLRCDAQAGRDLWPLDTEQALWRTKSTETTAQWLAELDGITCPAARWLYRRLKMEVRPRPVFSARKVPQESTPGLPVTRRTAGRWLAAPKRPVPWALDGRLGTHTFDTDPLWAAFCAGRASGAALIALMALPHHREMAASYLTAALADLRHRHNADDISALRLLASAQGRPHAATALCLLYAASSSSHTERAAAIETLQQFSLDGQLDGTTCGQVWAPVLANRSVPLEPLAATLEPLTSDVRQARLVWNMLQPTLPVLAADPPPGLAELVAVATAAAVQCDAAAALRRDTALLPGDIVASLAELADWPDEDLRRQAKRLRNVIGADRVTES